jgi:hydrogenase small subunit
MISVSRRAFLKYCTASAATLGLDPFDLTGLNQAMANPNGPNVLWLQGSSCTGCTMSFLNYIAPTAPKTAADVLISAINLAYHPNLSAAAGDTVVNEIARVYAAGNYILAIEGGIPTAFNGAACLAYTVNGKDIPFKDVVQDLASRAAKILCVGTCSSFGGIPAAPPNPTGVVSVKTLTGKPTIHIAGCPPHPDWIVWTVVQLLQNKTIALDSYQRPKTIYGTRVHERCPLKETEEVNTFGVPNRCLKEIGCHGPETSSNCPTIKWNNGVNWCIGAGAPCLGCTNASFPGTAPLYRGSDD